MITMMDQNTPYGSLSYDQTDTYTYNDPYTKKSYEIPRFTSTTTLSPEQQRLLESGNEAKQNLSDLAVDRSAFLKDYLGQTTDMTDTISGKLFDIGRQRLDPMFAERQDALETQLVNQGIARGSAAWDSAMRSAGQDRNDAYNQLLLGGRGQAMSEINAPINQITALLSGSQVSSPGVAMQTPQGMPYTDVAGLINTNYNQRMQQWQANQGMMGGLFGGLGSLGAGLIML